VSILITAEAVVGTVIDTLLVGLIFGKLQRSAPRSMSITFSHKAILRRIGNEMFFLFRVVEARKLQICEAHVRCYAVKHGEREDGTPLLFQQHVMRIMQPDDELGGMLLLMLPTEVVHQVSVSV
jgi:hypothetical protein